MILGKAFSSPLSAFPATFIFMLENIYIGGRESRLKFPKLHIWTTEA